MEKVLEKAYQLHDLLFKSESYRKLKEKEKEMVEDEALKPLFLSYHNAQEQYVTEKSEQNLARLHAIKLQIDSHPKVIAYQQSYKEYQILLGNITDIAFDGLIEKDDLLKKIRAL